MALGIYGFAGFILLVAGFMVKEQGSPLDGLISCGTYQVDRLMVGANG